MPNGVHSCNTSLSQITSNAGLEGAGNRCFGENSIPRPWTLRGDTRHLSAVPTSHRVAGGSRLYDEEWVDDASATFQHLTGRRARAALTTRNGWMAHGARAAAAESNVGPWKENKNKERNVGVYADWHMLGDRPNTLTWVWAAPWKIE